jgi:exo-1,4-beta-D-glucosaminidase
MSALNTMPRSDLDVSAQVSDSMGEKQVTITLTNPANRVAFFVRAEVTHGADGNEILPITYDDNYITVFPHEIRTIVARFAAVPGGSAPGGPAPALRVEGYNVAKQVISLK